MDIWVEDSGNEARLGCLQRIRLLEIVMRLDRQCALNGSTDTLISVSRATPQPWKVNSKARDAYLHVEQNLKAAALKWCAFGALQVCRPLVEIILHRQLDVLVLPWGWGGADQQAKEKNYICKTVTLLCCASRNSFINRWDIFEGKKKTLEIRERKWKQKLNNSFSICITT